jgi:hypothetical protein
MTCHRLERPSGTERPASRTASAFPKPDEPNYPLPGADTSPCQQATTMMCKPFNHHFPRRSSGSITGSLPGRFGARPAPSSQAWRPYAGEVFLKPRQNPSIRRAAVEACHHSHKMTRKQIPQLSGVCQGWACKPKKGRGQALTVSPYRSICARRVPDTRRELAYPDRLRVSVSAGQQDGMTARLLARMIAKQLTV